MKKKNTNELQKKKPLTMKHLLEMILFLVKEKDEARKRITLLELQVDELIKSMGKTVNPMLLEHETYIRERKRKPWFIRFLGF